MRRILPSAPVCEMYTRFFRRRLIAAVQWAKLVLNLNNSPLNLGETRASCRTLRGGGLLRLGEPHRNLDSSCGLRTDRGVPVEVSVVRGDALQPVPQHF